MKQYNDEHIKTYLKDMPKVKDHVTQKEWQERIKPSTYKRKRVPRKHSRMIPLLSTALFIGILWLIIPSMIEGPSSTMDESTISTNTSRNSQTSSDMDAKESKSTPIRNKEIGRYVVFEIDDDERIVYGGTFDENVQFIIPITLITSEEASLSTLYTHLHTYLNTIDDHLLVPYFKEVSFDINLENHTVVMEVPDDYSIGEGSAVQGKFEQMLSTIFYPYGIEKVMIQNSEGSSVSFGEMGEIPAIEVMKPVVANYKYYYDSESKQDFLIPIEQEGSSFSEAIVDLQKANKQFSIQATIPSEIDLGVDCLSKSECTIMFDTNTEYLSEDELVLAIESILMTASSYGYTHVLFDGLTEVSIPGYDLSEPLEVPVSVNPRKVHE